jgi:hypothetical protein
MRKPEHTNEKEAQSPVPRSSSIPCDMTEKEAISCLHYLHVRPTVVPEPGQRLFAMFLNRRDHHLPTIQ